MFSTLAFPLLALALLMTPTSAADYRLTVYIGASASSSSVCKQWKTTCGGVVKAATKKSAAVSQVCQFENDHLSQVEAFCRFSDKDYTAAVAKKLGGSLDQPKAIYAALVSVKAGKEKNFCGQLSAATTGGCAEICSQQSADPNTECQRIGSKYVLAKCTCTPTGQAQYDATSDAIKYLAATYKSWFIELVDVQGTRSTCANAPTSPSKPQPSLVPFSVSVKKGQEAKFCNALSKGPYDETTDGICADICSAYGTDPATVCKKKASGLVTAQCLCGTSDQTKYALTYLTAFKPKIVSQTMASSLT